MKAIYPPYFKQHITNKTFNKVFYSVIVLLVFGMGELWGQQLVFSINNSGTPNWWDESINPWFYLSWQSNENRPDLWPVGTRNDVYIGHNNSNPMNVNGVFFQIRDLNIQVEVTIERTYNSIDGGGISLSKGFYSASASQQTFNVPFGVDGPNVDFQAQSGNVLFTSDLFLNNNNAVFDGVGLFTVSGPITGVGGRVTKNGTNILVFASNGNTYTGQTEINEGTLQLNPSGDTSLSTSFILNGGTLSTSFIAPDRIINTSGNLILNDDSSIILHNVNHIISFAVSNAVTWSDSTLTITGWTGIAGSSGTNGKIFVGTDATGLTAAQLDKIIFVGYPCKAMILDTGEVVPQPTPNTSPIIQENP